MLKYISAGEKHPQLQTNKKHTGGQWQTEGCFFGATTIENNEEEVAACDWLFQQYGV